MEPDLDDAELARRAREGDREALAELVERVRLPLFGLAYAELRHYEDAQDAVAAALLQICRHIGELREPERARQWMHRITRNEARLILRRRQTAPLSLAAAAWELDASGRKGTAAEAEYSALRLDIQRALRQLPRDEARALALFYLARLSIAEIAGRVGRPEGTIKRWLHLGRRRLAAQLEGYAPMEESTAVIWAAAILTTDMEPATLQKVVDAMKASGWDDVISLGAGPVVERIVAGESAEIRLTPRLRGKQFILMDDSPGGRSAFELYTLLKATAEAEGMAFGLLSRSAEESTVWAAHLAGFDLCLTQPVDPEKLGRLSGFLLSTLKRNGDSSPSG